MDKRDFLWAAAAAAALPARAASDLALGTPAAARQPTLLTIAGRIGRANRGASHAVGDQLFKKHGVEFPQAFTLGLADLTRMPATTFRTTIEYDARVHELRGPLMADVLRAASVDLNARLDLVMRAVDGYSPRLPLVQVLQRRMIVATHLDGEPLGLGGLGPLWGIYDADAQPDLRDKPLPDRFAPCPWGLYFIEVVA